MFAPHRRPRFLALFIAAALALSLTDLFFCARHNDNRQKLWDIVHDQCIPAQQTGHNPAPCVRLDLSQGADKGYAILPDIHGVAQFLLIPTRRIPGVESPILLQTQTPDYWAAAWQARQDMFAKLHKELPRDAVGMAINSAYARSQDQLHIHIDCLSPAVAQQLRQHREEIGPDWAPLAVDLAGRRYMAMRMESADLRGTNPFIILAAGLHINASDMGKETLVIAGATFSGGKDGFILLADRANPATGDTAHGEDLLDATCAIAAQP